MREDADGFNRRLSETGALVFRGFGVNHADTFAELLDGLGVERTTYRGGNSPRITLQDGLYTSTEYPSTQHISLHNELSYSARWPSRLYFCCVQPATTGGGTTLADGRSILESMDDSLHDTFDRRGVRYVRNLHSGIGLGRSWQATFETEDRGEVARVCDASRVELQWLSDGGVRLTHVGPAVVQHPVTQERVWFNQAEQFHPSSLPDDVSEALSAAYEGREEELPQWVTFGDGEPIPVNSLSVIREVTRRHTTVVDWQRGDVAIVDNLLSMHGRQPFTGAREVIVAMA